MIGIFVLDEHKDIAFLQYGEHEDIGEIVFYEHNKMCAAITMADCEETFDSEMFDDVADGLKRKSHILIAHMTREGECVSQYTVAVKILS